MQDNYKKSNNKSLKSLDNLLALKYKTTSRTNSKILIK